MKFQKIITKTYLKPYISMLKMCFKIKNGWKNIYQYFILINFSTTINTLALEYLIAASASVF
ncbi:hypothetical protein GCM10008906_22760 [Clostridium oceanicum]|uniref:Uncharacterized protein n=1 Tax=Clostridium oceanicum TaxID=1543 RepID=A0ABN1JK47_9CLOT